MWFNPIMKWLLKSPLHFAASGSTMLLTFRGRKSGRTYSTPVSYLELDGDLYTISSRDRVWWRNLRGHQDVRLRIAGRETGARPTVIEDRDRVVLALQNYLRAAPKRAKYLGVGLDPDGAPNSQAIEKLGSEKVVVKFAREPGKALEPGDESRRSLMGSWVK